MGGERSGERGGKVRRSGEGKILDLIARFQLP
jgi:hypothetical protein